MASNCIILSRDHVRNQSTAWLTDAISPAGRAGATGWHEWRPRGALGPLTNRGALAIALIRAELLQRRARRPAAPPPPIDVDRITEYGITARLSRSVRVF